MPNHPKRVLGPYEVKEKIGCLEVEMVPVDHSLPGAAGYIIYSDEGNLVYTGDIRFHGCRTEKQRTGRQTCEATLTTPVHLSLFALKV